MNSALRNAVAFLLHEASDREEGIAEAFSRIHGVCLPKTIEECLLLRVQYPVWDLAVRARQDVEARWPDWSTYGYPKYEATCEQAAKLVQEGRWPPA